MYSWMLAYMFFLISVIPWEITGTDLNNTNRIHKDSSEFMKTVENISI